MSQIVLNRGCPNTQPETKDIINASSEGMH